LDGEPYNWIELREALRVLGHEFASDCDMEVLLTDYAEWGTRWADRLNGVREFAVNDAHTRMVFLFKGPVRREAQSTSRESRVASRSNLRSGKSRHCIPRFERASQEGGGFSVPPHR
jgi:asparagine synthetase B (glutamine-hydrolysing)